MLQQSQAIKLPAYLIADAKKHAEREMRSVPKQVEYFYNLGKIAKDNPDLPREFIIEYLEGKRDMDEGGASHLDNHPAFLRFAQKGTPPKDGN